jgi:hypothetical protein
MICINLEWGETESTRSLFFLLYQLRMMDDDECGAVGGKSGKESRNTRRNPAPMPLSPPQIPHDLTITSACASAMVPFHVTLHYVMLATISVFGGWGDPSLQTSGSGSCDIALNSVNPRKSEQRFPVLGTIYGFLFRSGLPVEVIAHQMTWAVSWTRNHVLPALHDSLLFSSLIKQRCIN